MEKQELKESVLCNLRSVTQSCKGGVPLDRLERDYRDLIGTRIPFRDLGHNSLESFARSIPNVIRLTKGRDGSLMAEAVADSSTAHIASLISRQKQTVSKRGSKRSHFAQRRGGFNSKYVSRGDRNPYGSYSAARSSGGSYRSDFKSTSPAFSQFNKPSPTKYTGPAKYTGAITSTHKVSPAFSHSRTSPPNFKIEIKNTNHIPKARTPSPVTDPSPVRGPSPVETKAKSRHPLLVRGYEIAPRFQRLLQRKVEAKLLSQPQASATNSQTSATSSQTSRRSPMTPPRTPSPTPSPVKHPYAFTASSIASANSSRASPTENWDFPAPQALPLVSSSMAAQQESNGFYSSPQPRSPRPLRARLNVASASQQLDSAKSAKEYIEIYAKMNNLSIDYSTKTIGQKRKNKGYVTNLHLGENKYLSYPEVAPTREEAEEIAAQNAVEKIKESQVLPETPISNAEEIQLLLSRIEELVCEKPSGMFINGLQVEYEHQYNEQLPSSWVELLQRSTVVEIDQIEVAYGKVPEGAYYIVRPSRNLSSGSTTPSESSGKVYPELQDSENDEPLPIKDLPTNSVPLLMIPPGNEWGVYVTGVFATDSSQLLAARLIDTDDEFLILLRKMSTYYDSKIDPVDMVEEQHLYATIGARIEGELVMHRVLASRILDSDMIECYYVDEGTVDIVRKSDLQHLHSEFLKLPYQAIHFALDGLEEYVPFTTPQHLEVLKNQTFIAVVKRWCSEDYFLDDPAIHKVIYSVILYDTSDTETDICLNDTIKEIVSESLVCTLPQVNKTSQGFLTHVTSIGQIYVRFLHPSKSWLEVELEALYQFFEEACLENNLYIPSDGIFVAKCTFDSKWYRASVPEHPNAPQDPEMMEVIFVDYGYPCFVKKREICDLHFFSDFLSSLPYQAVKCELHNAFPSPECKWTIAASQRLLEMAPFGEELIIKVFSEGESGALPKISLHKRIYSNGDSFIISINENLASNYELFNDLSVVPSNGTVKAPSQLNLQRTTSQLSSKGSLANYVPSVASPIESSLKSPFKNLDVTSPDGIDWVTTPDMVKSPEEEDLSPPPLSQPEVPDPGEIFDVFVTTAASPRNFIVQPLQCTGAMDDLMNQMQQFYSVEENLIEMHPSLLQRNSFYAALHSDNMWYRVRLVSFDKNAPVEALVYYVDFGDFDQVNLQNLQKLYNQFRALPCQAIKASLSGVKPIGVDWNPEHCVIFKEMVREKKFVSIVQRKHLSEEQGFPHLELELTLVDTSDESKDVYLHELLIENKIALKTAF